MARTVIIANRLPIQIKLKNKKCEIVPSIGGLATGLRSVHQAEHSLWLGWTGIANEALNEDHFAQIDNQLRNNYKCIPVFLKQKEIDCFYHNFSNKTIWPLFHHFPMLTEYNRSYWEGYQHVNRLFFNKLKEFLEPEDRIWVQDYQLMLLPKMIKSHFRKTKIGYFLHIPFPSYEIFRLLPWRTEILQGILGSDLVGFHTYDYARHFLSSVRRILRFDATLGTISTGNRIVNVDVFPMGIDYEKYNSASEDKTVRNQRRKFNQRLKPLKIILSVDRLDYTKGIPNRLKAYDKFLEKYPKWKEKVALVLIAAPSRTHVDTYVELKRELDELVSQINSKHGTIGWMPVAYFYRTFSFKGLAALYGLADIMLVTPLRDGMNLIVKEYIACRNDKKGVTILSETAGASHELGEAFIVNPNNLDQIADSINLALQVPPDDQIKGNTLMHKRLKDYNVDFWAREFMYKLNQVTENQQSQRLHRLHINKQKEMLSQYETSSRRLFFLDYDGTMVGFKSKPELAMPDKNLLTILEKLGKNPKNHVIVISGRDKVTLENWFGQLPVHLVAGHGIWLRENGKSWDMIEKLSADWKEEIRPVLEFHVSRTPGSFIEEKAFSLAWHYRNCDPDFAAMRAGELKATLMGLTNNLNLGILDGNKVMEIKDTTVNKGRAALYWMNHVENDFILSIGDDWTDEDLFSVMPETAYSIKVGPKQSKARFYLEDVDEVRKLLKLIAELD